MLNTKSDKTQQDEEMKSAASAELTASGERNKEYLIMIDRSIAQLEAGKGQERELIEEDE